MNFDQMMLDLRKEYLAALPGKIQELESYLKTGNRAEVLGWLHKLKGTGKTYGLPEISQLAEVGEQVVGNTQRPLAQPGPLLRDLFAVICAERQAGREVHLERDPRFMELTTSRE